MSRRSELEILIVAQPSQYGVGVCVRQQAGAAVAAGHHVFVACPDRSHGPLADWVTEAGAEHLPLNLMRQPGLGDIRAILTLRRLMRGRDVVHLHSSKAGAVGRIAGATLPRRERPAIAFTTHYWSWQVESRLAVLYRWLERILAPRCEVIVAVSEQEAAEGRETLGRAGDRIVVIPNGVDRTRFSPEGPTADRRDTPLIVCIGRLSRQKGQDIAIAALARMEHRDAHLRLVGDEYPPGERRRLEEMASALGVAERIEWWGNVADTAPQFRAADVVIAPSRWEGMSLVFLEAMACGAPLVVTDVFGSQAIGPGGVIIPPEDPDSLARSIDELLSDPLRREQLGENARHRSAMFDLADTLERTLDLWSDLADSRNHSISAKVAT